ncbi:MAG TPA: hypothetical protein VGO03_13765 [Acidimicrobiia bacterium]
MGPFTSGHLTIIIVTLAMIIAFPFAAFAVTGNNVFVTDATSGVHAKVNNLGQLDTTAVVSGAVTAPPAAPSSMVALFPVQVTASEDDCAFYTPPAGQALVITRIDAYPYAPSGTVYIALSASNRINASSGCTPNKPLSYEDFVAGNPPHVIDLGAGVALAHGHYLNLTARGNGGGGGATLNIYGYLVPASACATGCW